MLKHASLYYCLAVDNFLTTHVNAPPRKRNMNEPTCFISTDADLSKASVPGQAGSICTLIIRLSVEF